MALYATLRRLGFAGAAAATLSLAGLAAQAETLKVSHQWSTSDVRHKVAQMVAEEVAKADVDLKLQIYPSKSLFKPRDQWTPLTRGQLDMAVLPLAYAGGRHPEFNLTLMPALVKNHDHAQRLNKSKFMDELEGILNDAGVVTLVRGWLAGGFAGKETCIQAPDGMKGLQTRAAGKSFEEMLAGAGASIASMPSSEIYSAMQTGVLDAANTSSSSFVSYRIYEQVECFTPPGDNALWFMYQPMLISKKSWDGLNEDQQTALREAAAKAEAYYAAEAKKQDDNAIEVFKKNGVKVVYMSDADFDKWRSIAQETSYATFVKSTPRGQELLDLALSVK